jgi:hypothetical protein
MESTDHSRDRREDVADGLMTASRGEAESVDVMKDFLRSLATGTEPRT